jgi:hypothetical protein
MIPGTTTRLSESKVASAATIHARTDVLLLTGNTSIANIIPHFGGTDVAGMVILVAFDSAIHIGMGPPNNILGNYDLPIHKCVTLIYSRGMSNQWVIMAPNSV